LIEAFGWTDTTPTEAPAGPGTMLLQDNYRADPDLDQAALPRADPSFQALPPHPASADLLVDKPYLLVLQSWT
jgi:hypothetical protein